MDDCMVRRTTGLLEAQLDGELVGLHVEQGTCYGFNATATRIWEMIEQPIRLSVLRERLLGEYDIDGETCDEQLQGLLRELQEQGLVEMEPLAQ